MPFLCILALYANTLTDPIDTADWNLEHAQVTGGMTLFDFWMRPVSSEDQASGIYRPMALTILRIEYLFFGESASSFHAMSIFLWLMAVSGFSLIAAWSGLMPLSRFFAVLFLGLHPMASQNLHFVAGQGALLALAFMLWGSILLRLWANQKSKMSWFMRWVLGIGVFGSFSCAVFSHEMGLLTPWVWLCVWLISRKARQFGAIGSRYALILLTAIIIVFVGYGYLRWHVLDGWLPTPELYFQIPDSWFGWLMLRFGVINQYIIRIFFPIHPTQVYEYDDNLISTVPFAFMIVVAWLVYGIWRRRDWGIALVWMLGMLVVLGQWVLISTFMSEELMIFALPGACLAVFLLARRLTMIRRWAIIIYGVEFVILGLFAIQGRVRGLEWKSQERLWKAEAELHPTRAWPLMRLAQTYLSEFRLLELSETLMKARVHAMPHQMGFILWLEAIAAVYRGDDMGLRAVFEEAASLLDKGPHENGFYLRLASAALRRGMAQWRQRLLEYERQLFPDSFIAAYRMAEMELELKHFERAKNIAQEALKLASTDTLTSATLLLQHIEQAEALNRQ